MDSDDDDEGGDKSEKDELKGKSQSDFVARWVRTVSSQVRWARVGKCTIHVHVHSGGWLLLRVQMS